jgi:hypothetical protein
MKTVSTENASFTFTLKSTKCTCKEGLYTLLSLINLTFQAALPHNRFGASEFMFGIGARVLHYFILEPRGQTPNAPLAPELHELVRAKMVAQDESLRSRLSALKWTIDSQSTIRVLLDGRPLETV